VSDYKKIILLKHQDILLRCNWLRSSDYHSQNFLLYWTQRIHSRFFQTCGINKSQKTMDNQARRTYLKLWRNIDIARTTSIVKNTRKMVRARRNFVFCRSRLYWKSSALLWKKIWHPSFYASDMCKWASQSFLVPGWLYQDSIKIFSTCNKNQMSKPSGKKIQKLIQSTTRRLVKENRYSFHEWLSSVSIRGLWQVRSRKQTFIWWFSEIFGSYWSVIPFSIKNSRKDERNINFNSKSCKGENWSWS